MCLLCYVGAAVSLQLCLAERVLCSLSIGDELDNHNTAVGCRMLPYIRPRGTTLSQLLYLNSQKTLRVRSVFALAFL